MNLKQIATLTTTLTLTPTLLLNINHPLHRAAALNLLTLTSAIMLAHLEKPGP